jgi:hypothetical protein
MWVMMLGNGSRSGVLKEKPKMASTMKSDVFRAEVKFS